MFHLFSFNVTGRVVILSADFHKQSKEALESFQSDGTDLVVGRACFGECNLLNVSNLNFEKKSGNSSVSCKPSDVHYLLFELFPV